MSNYYMMPSRQLGAVPSGPLVWVGLLSLVGTAVSVYHGYKRHSGSIKWAVLWGLAGSLFPIIALPVAFAQGLGEPMRTANKGKGRKRGKKRGTGSKRLKGAALERALARIWEREPGVQARLRVAGRRALTVGRDDERRAA